MINVLNMTKTGVVDDLFEFKFDFEFDNASTLPVNFVVMEQKKYLIAAGSTAKNVSTNTYYTYNGAGKEWFKTLSKTPIPTPTTDTNITENGNYSVVNNDTTGYNDVTVNVFSEPAVLISKDITVNGNYNASSDNANGYSTVNVNVPNTYTAEDEGKVVDNGELVAQTAYPAEITENDTYDTTNYNSITVNVSSGSGGNATFATVTEFNYVNDYLSLLTNIDIPDGVESIGDSAFSYCVSLTSITIPNSVTSIGEDAFNGCGSLETVTFESNSSLESIGLSAFYECGSLTSITIPNSVTSIESSVFMSCSSLTSITFEPTTPPTLSVGLGIPTTCIIRVPQGSLSAYTSKENYPDPSEYIYEEY